MTLVKYQYKAMSKTGQAVNDTMLAESQDLVAQKLKDSGLITIFVKEVKEEVGVKKAFGQFKKVTSTELNLITRQLAVLQKAGVGIILSLNSVSDQSENSKFKEIVSGIINDIKGGKSFSSAIESYPETFSPLYVNMIRAGEESGTLVSELEKLADLGEYEEKVGRRIKAATRYPIIVVCAIVVAFLILTVFVVPRFANVYASSGVDLPLPTLILLGINSTLTHYWWLLIMALGATIFSVNKYINTKKGRWLWDSLGLKVPIFGPLMTKIIMGRFARITGTLMRSGLPILRVLDLALAGAGNVVVADAIKKIKIDVQEGKSMSGAMKTTKLFPSVVVQMVAVGEDTGKVDELLMHVSAYYDGEVNFTIENITSLIEPILLLVLGGGVLLMALGIFMPMWNMMTLFKQ